jgi:hypothetical protein
LSLSGIAGKITCPLYIVAGKLDGLVPWQDAERLAREAGGDVELLVIETAITSPTTAAIAIGRRARTGCVGDWDSQPLTYTEGRKMGRILLVPAWLGLSAVLSGPGLPWGAETYPTRPIRMLVPFAAGSQTDILARWIGEKITERSGHQVGRGQSSERRRHDCLAVHAGGEPRRGTR